MLPQNLSSQEDFIRLESERIFGIIRKYLSSPSSEQNDPQKIAQNIVTEQKFQSLNITDDAELLSSDDPNLWILRCNYQGDIRLLRFRPAETPLPIDRLPVINLNGSFLETIVDSELVKGRHKSMILQENRSLECARIIANQNNDNLEFLNNKLESEINELFEKWLKNQPKW